MFPTNEIISSRDDHEESSASQPVSSSKLQYFVGTSEANGRPWYHGEISNSEAEELLFGCPPGQYLVRKDGPTKYYLSCVADDNTISHLPIRQLGRRFYFMGEKFVSLSDLVRYYSEVVEAAEPIHAPFAHSSCSTSATFSSEATLEMFMSISTYDGLAENDELSTTRGDIISGLERIDDSYIWARNETTGQIGYLFAETVVSILSSSNSVRDIPYFHQYLTAEALRMLSCVGAGAFLLRPSSQGPDAFALLVNTRGDQIEKFLIRGDPNGNDGFVLAGRRFQSIQHIIERYCGRPIASGARLSHAILPHLDREENSSGSISTTVTTTHIPQEWSSQMVTSVSIDAAADYVNHNCASHTVAAVLALRKSREEKAWKSCWVTLCDDPNGGCELIIFDAETSQKPRLVLDLSYCMMYSLDDSVFNREGCLFFSQNDIDLPGVYICFRPTKVLVKWLELLRPRVLGLRAGTVPVMVGLHFEPPKMSHIGLLQLHIDKYRSETLKSDGFYSAYGLISGIKVCCTAIIPASSNRGPSASVVFDCSFLLPLVPTESGSLQFSLLSHPGGGKKGRPFGMSALLPLPDSRPISDTPEIGFTFRAIRYRVKVLAIEQYMPLIDYLREGPEELLEWASDALSAQQRALLCTSLVSLLLSRRSDLLDLISRLVRRVLTTCSAESVMRQDSLATSLVTQALRVAGRSQLEDMLEAGSIAAVKMLQVSDVDNVISCLDSLVSPGSLVQDLLCLIARLSRERFPDEPHLVRRVVSVVYILRFANPLLISFMNGNPMSQQLAKGVQSAANAAATRSEDLTPSSKALRALFERIRVADNNPSVDTSDSLCCDWLAVVCHLLQQSVSIREGIPAIPSSLLRLIQLHQSSFP